MTHAGEGPHVVHGPHHPLARTDNAFHVAERKHALIHPMEMNDIGTAELRQLRDVSPKTSVVDIEKPVPRKAVGQKYLQPFRRKPEALEKPVRKRRHPRTVGLPVAHEEMGLNVVAAEGTQQTTGGNGRPAHSFGGVD